MLTESSTNEEKIVAALRQYNVDGTLPEDLTIFHLDDESLQVLQSSDGRLEVQIWADNCDSKFQMIDMLEGATGCFSPTARPLPVYTKMVNECSNWIISHLEERAHG